MTKSGTYSEPLPHEDERRCSKCDAVVQPFGTLRQWFCVNEDVLLCLPCARQFLPEQVAIAEELELYSQGQGPKATEQ